MSQMLAEISRIVTEDISNRVTQYDVLFEAITNSIHANATNIKCYLNSNDSQLTDDEKEIGSIRVDTIKIIDNGDGLTDENYKSFSKYRTEFKKALGCKGVGRFVFLKVYQSANYTSKIKSIQEQRSINFDFDFDTENLQKEKAEVLDNETQIFLSNLTKQYFDSENDKKQDKRIELDLHNIREKVLMNLIPTLFFYKQKGTNITIDFIDEFHQLSVQIKPDDVPDFLKKPFEIKNSDGIAFKFLLNYKVENTPGLLYTYYCANNRTVCQFEDKDFKISMPYGYSGFMLLESEYFNQKVNNERNDFDIYPVRTDIFSTLSWEMINAELRKHFSEIVKEGVPETKRINSEKIQQIQEERPYLVQYIEEEDIQMAGFLDKRAIIEKAKKRFDTAKEKVLINAGKEEYSDDELNDAIQLAQNELVSYINDRVIVIERLKALVDKSERVESIIHNLFMEKYTKDNYFSVGKNNLWLLDDRFTTYSYAASDKRIIEVLTDIKETLEDVDILNDKPDLSLFFSHNPNNPERLKSVMVEIKPFDFSTKSDRKKFNGVQQLIDYVKAFKKKENIQEVYGYLITDIDKKLADRLEIDDYVPLFSSEAPIYHRHYDKIGISIYVVSAKTLIYDAEARNKVFLEIIRKQARINRLIEKSETAK
ncbi:ATP-binding protein [Flavobacterium sp. NRK1]|uniref:ATP-binding protein n=1 Tax=Flavobacterium sp. NRK1 TaxID=2954929 RepID=UPI002093EF21|nr:ATP-binding protein [Flavobacterium sp. NRK1]MCO6147383.1 ATP-binding protein [Flavobacterium sp. NRK1]